MWNVPPLVGKLCRTLCGGQSVSSHGSSLLRNIYCQMESFKELQSAFRNKAGGKSTLSTWHAVFRSGRKWDDGRPNRSARHEEVRKQSHLTVQGIKESSKSLRKLSKSSLHHISNGCQESETALLPSRWFKSYFRWIKRDVCIFVRCQQLLVHRSGFWISCGLQMKHGFTSVDTRFTEKFKSAETDRRRRFPDRNNWAYLSIKKFISQFLMYSLIHQMRNMKIH
jgi:hypothetical protein